MQANNRLLDDFARLTSGALGIATGMRGEAEGLIRTRLQRLLSDMDLVSREEFDAVRILASNARSEQEKLEARVIELEARLEALSGGKKAPARKPGGAKPKPAK